MTEIILSPIFIQISPLLYILIERIVVFIYNIAYNFHSSILLKYNFPNKHNF